MDCQMPGMDGFVTTQKIRDFELDNLSNANNDHKKNIIVALTANALKDTRDRCLASGMNDYMTKPISYEELKDVLRKHLIPPTTP